MVAGGPRHGAEASPSRADPPASGEERVDALPPTSPTPRRSSSCGRSSVITGASLNRVLNEALRIHGGSAWRVFQVRWCSLVVPLACCFLICSVVLAFVFVFRCATLIGLRLLVEGARALRPRQVRRSRPDER
jgi:hypothetical protein